MAIFDKWVALKIVEFCFCVACLVAKRISADDEARLALLLQKFSREWSLLNSVTWDSVGASFADAVYGGYVIITFGLMLGRVFQEIPRGRRILEGFLLGMGLLFFLVLGGLELASLDSVPDNLIKNAAVIGTLSLIVAALFLLDLMSPRIYFATHQSQTEVSNLEPHKVNTISQTVPDGQVNGNMNGHINTQMNGHLKNQQQNGHLPNDKFNNHKKILLETDIDQLKNDMKSDSTILEKSKNGYTKFDQSVIEKELETSKFGSLRNGIEGGNYVRLSDPLAEPDRLHYEKELAKFNEKYFREYLDAFDGGRYRVKEDYLPEPQTPIFSKLKSRPKTLLFDDVPPHYEDRRSSSKSPTRVKTVPSPTLQQLEDYLKGSNRTRRGDTPIVYPMEPIDERDGPETEGRASGTPSDRGYVQYTADKWPEKRDLRTPRHSPT